jgi:ATP-binding cassette subfamily B protein
MPERPLPHEHAAPRLSQIVNLRHAVRMVWDAGPRYTVANLALLLVQGILPLFSLYILKLVVDSVAANVSVADRGPLIERVIWLILLEGLITLAGAVARSLSGLVSEAQSLTVTDRVQDVIHAKSVEADLEYYENAQYYDTLHRAQQEAGYRPTSIVNGLLRLAQSSITLTAIGALLISLHWLVAVLLVVTAVPAVLSRLVYARGLFSWQRKRTPADRLSSYISWILTRDTHAKEIRLFDLGSLFRNRYLDVRRQLRRERIALVRKRAAFETGAQVLGVLGVFASFAFMAYRTLLGASTIGDLVMYYQAFQRAQGMVRDLLGSMASLYEDSLFLSNFYEFINLKKTVAEPVAPLPVPRPMRSGITFDHVAFRYPHGAHEVVRDISLTVKPGEVIALVGENGSGKTTLCKLLCRLYDPTGGSIQMDGIDLRQFDTTLLRREISVIFQDYAHYNLSARENIWVGNTTLPLDSSRIAAAAQNAGADQALSRLPHGYDTILGKWFDEGEELSVGEWQKVALARAFLRDAQIVVLDEPTSSMDAKTEYEVFSRFRELVAGKSAVLVSHRFSTVRMADTIYVLDGGRITERGSHDELIRLGGVYAHLFEIQAQHYR